MTDPQRASVYVPIVKIEKADGGRTRIVTGIAASERLDYDGQHASYDWFKKELQTWFAPLAQGGGGGNLRQDHRPGGVGKAIRLEFDDEARTATVTSKAVAEETIRLLDEGVLQGYSWGAKSVPGNPIRIRKGADGSEWVEGGRIVELTYADSPCNADCVISLVKSVGKKGPQRTKILGDLPGGVTIRQAGEPDYDAILRNLLADIAKRDVSAAERERLGAAGHAIDTGQDHPSYPIANATDLDHAVKAYGRANPEDRAKLRRHIISEAKRLNRTDLIPDDWKSVGGLLKAMGGCDCCDDCGPNCQGDCCDDCTMRKAVGPATIVAGVKALAEGEPDGEYRAFLTKLATAVEGWASAPGVALDGASFLTLASLNRASGEPDLAKRRTFYTQGGRAAVEQAMQNLHQVLGLFMEGAPAADADKDQRTNKLTGQDSPPASDQPGGPGTAPEDGVPDDGNMAYDPSLVRDGDPDIRQPDGERDGRAQGEAGTHTWPPAGDAPGQGPGDQGKGESAGGKGKAPFDGQQSPTKATKAERKLAKLRAEVAELRKGVAPTSTPVQVNQTLGQRSPELPERARVLRREVKRIGADLRKVLDGQHAAVPGTTTEAAAMIERRLEKALSKITNRLEARDRRRAEKALRAEVARTTEAVRALVDNPARPQDAETAVKALVDQHERRVQKLLKRFQAMPAPIVQLDPVTEAITRLEKAVMVAAARPSNDGTPQTIDSSLLLADLTRAAYEQTRKDLAEVSEKLARRVKRAERKLQRTAAAETQRLDKVVEGVNSLGRLPHPAGPQLVRATDKTLPVNDTIERGLSPELVADAALYNELAKSTDPVVAEGAKQQLRRLMEFAG